MTNSWLFRVFRVFSSYMGYDTEGGASVHRRRWVGYRSPPVCEEVQRRFERPSPQHAYTDCANPCSCAFFQKALKAELPCIANCMVVGDKRKFLTVLIALKSVVSVAGASCMCLHIRLPFGHKMVDD